MGQERPIDIGRDIYQVVPVQRQGPDLLVLQPAEGVQVAARQGVDLLHRQSPIGLVIAVPQDDGGPVLAGIRGLDLAVHLLCLSRYMLMLDHLDRVFRVGLLEQVGDVPQNQHVAVEE